MGEERSHERAALCERGYHSSPTLFDGLPYAPGPVACLVEVSDPVEADSSKQVSLSRKLLAAVDVARELRLWACDCAERALLWERKAGREPDARSWTAITVARRSAEGQATKAELADAYAAADAAYDAYAAAAAADAAYAARAAAADAAYAARAAAAHAAEIAWQRARFDELVTARLLEAVAI